MPGCYYGEKAEREYVLLTWMSTMYSMCYYPKCYRCQKFRSCLTQHVLDLPKMLRLNGALHVVLARFFLAISTSPVIRSSSTAFWPCDIFLLASAYRSTLGTLCI